MARFRSWLRMRSAAWRCRGGHLLRGGWVMGRRLRYLSPVAAATGQVTCSTLVVLPLALLPEQPRRIGLPPLAVRGSLAGTGLFSTTPAYLIFFAIVRRAGGGNVMLVTLMIPPAPSCPGGDPLQAGQHRTACRHGADRDGAAGGRWPSPAAPARSVSRAGMHQALSREVTNDLLRCRGNPRRSVANE